MESDIAFIESEHGTKNLYGVKSNLAKLHETVDKLMDIKPKEGMVEITSSLNYDAERDMYWSGILGWVPDYVNELQEDPLCTKDGDFYKYLYHTGKLGEEVYVYFKKY